MVVEEIEAREETGEAGEVRGAREVTVGEASVEAANPQAASPHPRIEVPGIIQTRQRAAVTGIIDTGTKVISVLHHSRVLG